MNIKFPQFPVPPATRLMRDGCYTPLVPHKWFAWYPVELGALGGRWAWLRYVQKIPSPSGYPTIYQELGEDQDVVNISYDGQVSVNLESKKALAKIFANTARVSRCYEKQRRIE
jgi:hypothetical protein